MSETGHPPRVRCGAMETNLKSFDIDRGRSALKRKNKNRQADRSYKTQEFCTTNVGPLLVDETYRQQTERLTAIR